MRKLDPSVQEKGLHWPSTQNDLLQIIVMISMTKTMITVLMRSNNENPEGQENNLQQPLMQKPLLDYHDFNGDDIDDGIAPENTQ